MNNILITGCSTGIGLETALILKNNGFKVYASARKEEDVIKLQNLGFETFKITWLFIKVSTSDSGILESVITKSISVPLMTFETFEAK